MKTNNILSAISEPTRLKILEIIRDGEICACMIPEKVKKSQPAVSQHLSVLSEAGLIECRQDGAKRMYSLNRLGKRVLKDIKAW